MQLGCKKMEFKMYGTNMMDVQASSDAQQLQIICHEFRSQYLTHCLLEDIKCFKQDCCHYHTIRHLMKHRVPDHHICLYMTSYKTAQQHWSKPTIDIMAAIKYNTLR